MRLSLPPVKGIDAKHRRGFIGQLIVPERDVEGEWTRFVLPSATGHRLTTADGEVLYAFAKAPKDGQVPVDGAVLIGPFPTDHPNVSTCGHPSGWSILQLADPRRGQREPERLG